jgi:ABC-type polysaccharide/polyol phosphate transport system ATPase subunit
MLHYAGTVKARAMDSAISVRGLGKCYRLYDRTLDRVTDAFSLSKRRGREFWALRGFDLEMPHGATWGIVGRNGSGKSTALKMIAGRLRPTEGDVRAAGRVSAILELGTGLHPHLTGRQNARVNGLFMGLDPWKLEERLEQIIEFSELGSYADQALDTYSSGMRARLAFSVLTALEPEIMILDEALATGDAGFARKCTRFIRDLCRSGCSTLVVSHDMNFMTTTCERLIWLEKGTIRAQGDPATVGREYLASLGAGEDSDFRHRPRNVLFRLEPVSRDDAFEARFHCIEWLGPSGAVIEQLYPGTTAGFSVMLDAGADLGFQPESLRAAWGEAFLAPQTTAWVRTLSPHRGPDGVAFLPMPVPAAPSPLPTAVRIWCVPDPRHEMTLSALIDGRFERLGTFGARSGSPSVHDWTSEPFSVQFGVETQTTARDVPVA